MTVTEMILQNESRKADRDRNYIWKDIIVKQNNSILFHLETVILFLFLKKIDWNEGDEE